MVTKTNKTNKTTKTTTTMVPTNTVRQQLITAVVTVKLTHLGSPESSSKSWQSCATVVSSIAIDVK